MNKFNLDYIFQSLGDVIPTALIVIAVVLAFEVLLYLILKKGLNSRYALPLMLVIPAALGLLILVVYPILYNFFLAFTDLSAASLKLYASAPLANEIKALDGSSIQTLADGFQNMLVTINKVMPDAIPKQEAQRLLAQVGTGDAYPLYNVAIGFGTFADNIHSLFSQSLLKTDSGYFGWVFLRTLIWTVVQVGFHTSIGLMVAMLLNRKMRGRGVYRALILFPWAVPQIIAVLVWRTEFNSGFGLVNIVLRGLFGEGAGVSWLTDPTWNFVAINIVNIWLGVPFMAMTLLGGLQSIDTSYYEAAQMDGARGYQRFTRITLPLLQPVLAPCVMLGVIWTFNNFNVPYFINQNGLEQSDILVTALFRAAFQYYQYGFASAFAIAIFVILLGLTLLYFKVGKVKIDLDDSVGKQRAVGE